MKTTIKTTSIAAAFALFALPSVAQITSEQVISSLEGQGYSDVQIVAEDDDVISTTAVSSEGQAVNVIYDRETGAVRSATAANAGASAGDAGATADADADAAETTGGDEASGGAADADGASADSGAPSLDDSQGGADEPGASVGDEPASGADDGADASLSDSGSTAQ
ncbi:PepSY domain-containing protein [Paracoccus sediminicola]|uniref:PepSY domain-containing protein n=1 Tax=Paracoccus sediminicola TaxID=3017783 RepID=UPI0022F0C3B7|nr:PepSY domain-containing protein [Paracoccus sediminicola]WBU55847.1 PepSY domain-containing protein [Paracoccus sediminicola]